MIDHLTRDMSNNDDLRSDPPDTIHDTDSDRSETVELREDEFVVIRNLLTTGTMLGPNAHLRSGTANFRRCLADRLTDQFYEDDGEDDVDPRADPDYLNGKSDTEILEQAAEVVYDRPDQHGEPEDSFERIADLWGAYLGVSGTPLDIDDEDVANMMILLKVARNAEGHYHADNYVDIAGYAENGARLGDISTDDR